MWLSFFSAILTIIIGVILAHASNSKGNSVVDIEKYQIRLAGIKYAPTPALLSAVKQTAKTAIDQQQTHKLRDNKNRLAIIVAFSFNLKPPLSDKLQERLAYLRCSLSHVYNHIASYTPSDVFLFVERNSVSHIPKWIANEFPKLIVLPIPPESWKVPEHVGHPSTWRFFGQVFFEDYFLMGRWRMTFAMEFVKKMKYEYMLQIDDDSFQLQPIPFNIVDHFDRNHIHMGICGRTFTEIPDVLAGLPELTCYWMQTRNLTTPHHFPGTLFQHTTPSDSSGVNQRGWDRKLHSGSFVVMSTAFWFDEVVSDFVGTILSTGSDIEMRWTEQAVQNMARLLFLPDSAVHHFPATHLVHGKPGLNNMNIVGCAKPDTSHFKDSDLLRCQTPVLINESSLRSEEIVMFDWQCDTYSELHGDCASTQNRLKSLNWYIRSLCRSFHQPKSDIEYCVADTIVFVEKACFADLKLDHSSTETELKVDGDIAKLANSPGPKNTKPKSKPNKSNYERKKNKRSKGTTKKKI